MKYKVGKEPEGGSKNRKEVENESPLASMFQKQQTANDLQKAQEAYLSILEKGKQLGLHEEAHAEPVRRSENDTHPNVECDTVHATVDAAVPKRSVNPNCVPKPVFTTSWFLNNFKTASLLSMQKCPAVVNIKTLK